MKQQTSIQSETVMASGDKDAASPVSIEGTGADRLDMARQSVQQQQSKLTSLRNDFEAMQRDRERLMQSLDYELANCRNGDERDSVHAKIAFAKKETIELNKVWQRDIFNVGNELVERNCELREIIHHRNMKEFEAFKSTVDLNSLFRAYAFHNETFNSTNWGEFLFLIYRKPTGYELEQFQDEIIELP